MLRVGKEVLPVCTEGLPVRKKVLPVRKEVLPVRVSACVCVCVCVCVSDFNVPVSYRVSNGLSAPSPGAANVKPKADGQTKHTVATINEAYKIRRQNRVQRGHNGYGACFRRGRGQT